MRRFLRWPSRLAAGGLFVGMLPVLATTASTVTATQVSVLGGPAHAEMYPSGVAVAPDGTIVVADTGNDQIATYDPAGNPIWRVGKFGSGQNQFAQPRDVGVDSAGNIFVADDANTRVDKLSPTGAFITSFKGPSTDNVGAPIGISVRADLVYVADPNHGRVHVFDTSGNQVSSFGSSGSCNIGRLRDVDADGAGDMYIANYTSNNIVKLAPDGTCLLLWGSKGTGPGQFKNPYGIAVAVDPVLGGEAVYVADSNNQRIQEFTLTGTFVAAFGSAGNTPGTFTQLRRVAVATDGTGDVWGADLWGYRVERFSRGASGYTYAQTIGAVPPPLDATHAFNQVRGIAFDGSGNLVAADTVNQRFVRMTTSGAILNACGIRGFSDPGEFNWPRGVAVDQSTGQIWVADTKQSDIQVLQNDCTPVAHFGTLGPALGKFNLPSSIAIRQSDGTAWIADTKNNRVVVYNVATRAPIAAFGGKGSGTGQFNGPSGIAVSAATGHILVADTANNRVVELSDAGGGSGISVVQTLTDKFRRPQGVAADSLGNIAVADSLNSRVVVLSSAGVEEAVIKGSFYRPENVAFDPTDLLYVADTYNDRIVTYSLSTSTASPLAHSRTVAALTSTAPIYSGAILGPGLASMYPVDISHTASHYYVLDAGRFRVAAVNRSTGNIDFQVGGTQGAGPGQFGDARAIAHDSAGNIYVADTPHNRVEKFDASLNYLTSWGTRGSGNGQFHADYGVATGTGLLADGVTPGEVVYVTDGAGRIEKFDLGGNYISQFGSGLLNQPRQLVIHPTTNNVYLVNSGTSKVMVFSPAGSLLYSFGGPGTGPGQFTNQPRGIAIAPDGTVYVVDAGGARVEAFDSGGTYLFQVGSKGTGPGQLTGPRGVTATEDGLLAVTDEWDFSLNEFELGGPFVRKLFGAKPPVPGVNSPRGITVDGSGKLVVDDYWNQRIETVAPDGTNATAFGFRGVRTAPGALNFAWGVAVQPSTGRFFVANRESHNIVVFNADGTWATKWGKRGTGPGQLLYPEGVAFAPDGTLLVADSGNSRVERFAIDSGGDGSFMAQYGQKGTTSSGPGFLNTPASVAVGADGTIWVADTLNNSIQSMSPGGTWTRFWKNTGQRFKVPWGVTVAPDGTIWVPDTGNNRIVQMTTSGSILMTATGTDLGAGPLNGPSSIAFGRSGHIYISDTWNNRVIDALA